jgi:2-dehydro-3-deoxyphosphogluconate aldolase/(4S)-4-hydroxy-2-oxoglutarate aldolase
MDRHSRFIGKIGIFTSEVLWVDVISQLERSKMIAIIRGFNAEQAGKTVRALSLGGIRFVEVTMNTPGATGMIADWRSEFNETMYIGAGTVIDLGMAKEAIAAGAQFIVTPNTDAEVIEYALSRDIEVFPGAFTPTEIVHAWKLGARAVKLFPMASLGLQYLKEIRGPLDHIRLIPTGGVNLNNMADFIQAGAFACGLGSHLINKSLIQADQYEEISKLAEEYVAAVGNTIQ